MSNPERRPGQRGHTRVYALATSLRADFRRVEDSWREADRQLRQAILSAQQHRGSIVDQLLGSHASLLSTPEGVFGAFSSSCHQQRNPLRRSSSILFFDGLY